MYKLTVKIPEHQRKYVKLLVKRMNMESNNKLIESLIDEKTASLFHSS